MLNCISNLDNKISELVILHKNALKFIIFFIFILILRLTINNNYLLFFLSYLLIIYDNTKYLKLHKNILVSLFHNKINNIFVCILPILYYYNFYYIYSIFSLYLIFLFVHFYNYFCNNYIKLVSVQNCFSDQQNFWTYTFLVNYNNEKKLITKRFSECYNLINNFNINFCKNYLLLNNTFNNTFKKAHKLNIKFNELINNKSILHNSIFNNFINDNNTYNNTTIIEKHNICINKSLINNDYIDNIKQKCKILINTNIEDLFILNEINYFNISKKRILLCTHDSIIKIKYIITKNTFSISNIFKFNCISHIEISTIKNTTYFKNKKIIIIYYNNTNIKLISINDSYYYNIESFIKNINKKNIIIIHTDSYTLNNGLALTENVFNNNYYIDFKNSILNYYKYMNN